MLDFYYLLVGKIWGLGTSPVPTKSYSSTFLLLFRWEILCCSWMHRGDLDLVYKGYSKRSLKSNYSNVLKRKIMDYLYHFIGSVMYIKIFPLLCAFYRNIVKLFKERCIVDKVTYREFLSLSSVRIKTMHKAVNNDKMQHNYLQFCSGKSLFYKLFLFMKHSEMVICFFSFFKNSLFLPLHIYKENILSGLGLLAWLHF